MRIASETPASGAFSILSEDFWLAGTSLGWLCNGVKIMKIVFGWCWKMLVDIHGVCPIVGLGPGIVGQGVPCPYIGVPWVVKDSETIGLMR
jgi:hypothetical protein